MAPPACSATGKSRRPRATPPRSPGFNRKSDSWRWTGISCRRAPVHEPGPAAGDGGSGSPIVFDSAPVHPAWSEPVRPVLSVQGNLGGGSCPDAGHGPAVPGDHLLRVWRIMRAWLERQGMEVSRKQVQRLNAHHGAAVHLPGPPHQPASAGAPSISLFVGECPDHPAQPQGLSKVL